jgi:hypothetical protein
MKIIHQQAGVLAIVFAFQIIVMSAFGSTTNWFDATKDIKVGSPEEVVRKTMERYKSESWQTFTNSYSQFAQCLVVGKTAIWVMDVPDWPTKGMTNHFYIIALFSEENKLSDLLKFELPIGFTPLVKGTYAQRLESIKVGMNVDDIYRLLGEKIPMRYYRDESKCWMVELMYSGSSEGSLVDYQADAATGVIKATQGFIF